MNRQRIEFPLPYKVKTGSDVLNTLGESVGQVIGVRKANSLKDKPYVDRYGNKIEGPWFIIEADVNEDALDGKLQCMEPTIPVS
jgi:hypothetical protein